MLSAKSQHSQLLLQPPNPLKLGLSAFIGSHPNIAFPLGDGFELFGNQEFGQAFPSLFSFKKLAA